MGDGKFNPVDFPGIDLAYEFVEPSFSWMFGRIDAAKDRLSRIQTFAATITFAAPVLAKSICPEISFESGWLYAALAVFAGMLIASTVALSLGRAIEVLSPDLLWRHWLRLAPQSFKKDAIYLSGQAFNHNAKAVDRMGIFSRILNVAVGVQVLLLVLWLLFAG